MSNQEKESPNPLIPAGSFAQRIATLVDQLLHAPSPEVAGALARAVVALDDAHIRAGLLDGLGRLAHPPSIDTVCAAWAETRHPALEALLVDRDWQATAPPTLAILTLLKTGHGAVLGDADPERVFALLAAAGDPDATIRRSALDVLHRLTDVASQEMLCRLVLKEDDATAREVCLAAGYHPQHPQERALFFLLTEQWDAYEGLDFDSGLLATIYEAADESLRRRIGDFARRSGRAQFVQVLAGGRRRRHLVDLTADEWQVVSSLLIRHHDGEQMWQLAQVAPPVRSKPLLVAMAEHGLVPAAEAERNAWQEMLALARACPGFEPPLGGLAKPRTQLIGHTGKVWDLVFASSLPAGVEAPAGTPMLVSAGKDGTVRFWSPLEMAAIKTLPAHTDSVERLAVRPAPDGEGSWLLSAGDNWLPAPARASEGIQLWHLPSGRALATLPKCGPPFCLLPPAGDEPASEARLVSGNKDGSLRWWSLPTGQALGRARGHRKAVHQLLPVPGRPQMVSAGEDDAIIVWDTRGDATPTRLNGHTGAVWELLPYPEAELLASASHDHTIRLWRLPTGEPVKTLAGHEHGVSTLLLGAALPAGGGRQMISASTDNTIRLWRLPDGLLMNVVAGRGPLSASPDGQILAGRGTDGDAWLWQLPEGTPLTTLSAGATGDDALLTGRSITCLAFSPDGHWLSGGYNDGVIRLWTSDLIDLCHTPVVQATLAQLQWAQHSAAVRGTSAPERAWLAFLLALLRWRRRFDIEIEELPTHISIGEFDVEIE